MRDFNNLDLIQKIENSPFEYIIQRKVNLLDSFLLGYEHILLTIKNIESLQIKYKNTPSMEEYAREKYNGTSIGSRNFKSILKFNCENELEYYDNYLCFIKEYESKHLLENAIEFTINNKPLHTLKNVLHSIKKRFLMYFGNYDLENFRAFFDGYIRCKRDYGIAIDDFENKIIDFLNRIKCDIIDMDGKNITWDRRYRYNMYWDAWGQIGEIQGKKIIDSFFEETENNIGEKL
jgi:predicted DNA-binding protein YlxM (UPF0122 family)